MYVSRQIRSKILKIFDIESLKLKKMKFSGHSSPITHLETNQDRSELISSCEKGQLRIYDISTQKVKQGFKIQKEISKFCILDHLIYLSFDNQIAMFDKRSNTTQFVCKDASFPFDIKFDEDVNDLCCHENGQFLATADDSGCIKVLDLRMNQEYKRMKWKHDNVKVPICKCFLKM